MRSQPPLLSRGLAIVMVALFLGAMVPNLFILTSRLLGDLGYDEGEIGLVMTAFTLTSTLSYPLIGRATERFGHAWVIGAGCVASAIGAALFLVVDTLPGYALARALQGAGGGATLVAGVAYVAEAAPLLRLGQALGLAGVLTLAAQAVGPALGEALIPVGWDALFVASIGFALVGAAVAAAIPRVRRAGHDDLAAATPAAPLLVATGLAAVGFGAIWAFLADYVTDVGIGRTTYFFVPYVAAAIATRVFLGHLSDRIGRRRAAVPALFANAAILLVLAALEHAWHLVVAGLVYGLSHGVYYPTLQAMIVERSGGRRSRAIAASSFAFGIGVVVAGAGLGLVARTWGYPAIYPIAAACGLAAALLSARREPAV